MSGNPVFHTQTGTTLARKLLHLGSNEGDLILDSFAGSGTTGAVAHKMRRCWILVEVMQDTVDQYIIRLRNLLLTMKKICYGPENGLPSIVNHDYDQDRW